ncbi:unnamed protein product [Medioppia subpectinata]|uniref:G/T mismatch-specific thymine DNA glycosylase n=1 Tax=Medioppia subpectinata TaxID=1979941 RepID=A0A7R9PYW1_9ACAR|nr:unnamed protein product [Medioppia subpectinata]CAG2105564.1 unnamed protein product [Medioppia subpectinata]
MDLMCTTFSEHTSRMATCDEFVKREKRDSCGDTRVKRCNRVNTENRFHGLSESQLKDKTLADHLDHDLDVLIIGINPGYNAARSGHHYAGPGNHFWKCLYLSQLVSKPMTALDDFRLVDRSHKYRIGFTNIVSRTTRGSDCLTKDEIRKGAQVLRNKLKTYLPKIAVFNGKGIYEVFCGTTRFQLGLQPKSMDSTLIYVMPSSSARCSQLPRASDKLPFYIGLKQLLDKIHLSMPIDSNEFIFPNLESNKKICKPIKEEESAPTQQSIYFS